MRKAAMTVLAALAALGGCDRGEPTPVKKITVGQGGAYAEKLRGLSPLDRDLALRRAIQDSRQRCRRILSSAESGSYRNMAIWTARCDGGIDWAVFVAPSGDVQVRSCRHVEQLGLPKCRTSAQSAPASSVKG